MGSFMGQILRRELAKIEAGTSDKTTADLLAWYEQYQDRLDAEDLAAVRAALKIEVPLAERAFRSLVPSGWLADVLELTSELETPSAFIFLAALTVLGQAVGRNVCIRRGASTLWTGMSGLLISPAGRGRRSTGTDFVVYELGVPAGVKVISDSFSYEAFGDALAELPAPSALIYAGEMSVLLGKKSYGESIIPKLTDIVGKTSQFNWRTVKRGLITFKQPCVNALLTSAPDWLVENIPAVAFGGGFMSRFLVCVQERREQIVPWGEVVKAEALKEMVHRLKQVALTRGEFGKPQDEAFEWYRSWYMAHSEALESGRLGDDRMAPYYSRKHDHLLRLAALLSLAHQEPLVFQVPRLQQALTILDWLEAGMPKAYANMALSPLVVAQKAITTNLARAGGSMEHSTLHKKVYRLMPLASHFKEVMGSLVSMGVVQAVQGLSKRSTTYILTKTLD